MIIKKIKNCRACGSKKILKTFALRDSPIGDDYTKKISNQKKYPIEVYMCALCGLSQLGHVVNKKTLYSKYIYKTQDSPGLVKHFNLVAKHLKKKLSLKKNSSILDIGSNDGVLLSFFKKQKCKTVGIEPAKKISDYANKNGIKTYNNFLSKKLSSQIKKKEGKFDLVISNNVFANIDNINDWVKNIKFLLKQDGVYVFETFYLSSLIKNSVFDFIYHEHLSLFSIKPLYQLFKKYNLQLFDVEFVSTKGGSVRCYIRHFNKSDFLPPKINKIIKNEIRQGLYKKITYKKFSKKISLLALKTLSELKKLKKKFIIGYGASISCTTLIYHYQIKDYLKILVDDNTNKIGTYLPGSQIKVHDSKILKNLNCDCIIVLAWRFAPMILKKIKKYNLKTKILLPCPIFKDIK
jgi:2-polyprenyl-3-methyl-5-hydroxy-6-metoxy-1,4-benzoquinol methylase